ncbi:MFS transporter [Actinomyces ruminis]|uniref:MFS transporter n=1 Tax=Actinomyces ruminis TaxID=1937003 RepID=UPI00211EE401|nr:MFS transporter [Actinomyces ruminis]
MRPNRSQPAAVTAGLVIALAVQNAVPPFATDMYSPAFPRITVDLGTSSTAVGLTLTAFFIGMALGQVVGGTASDRYGRRRPMLLGGAVCTLGAVVCALAPGIGVLLVGRLLQGFGGGTAAWWDARCSSTSPTDHAWPPPCRSSWRSAPWRP